MKKAILLLLPVLLIAAGAGAVWWKYGRARDPLVLAQQMMDRGDLRGAQLELRGALRVNPANAAAHFRLGQVHLRLGDPIAAEKELKTARDQGFEPRLITPLLAQAYIAQGRYRELIRELPAQGLPPEQATQLLNLRALAQLALGDQAAATASAAEAERQSPNSVEAALTSARILLARRDFTGAETKIDRALQINPRAVDALVMKGQMQNLKGDRTRALESFDAALAQNPANLPARLERANILLMDGKDARAREDVEAALKIEPRSAMGLYLRAVLNVKDEKFSEADADLAKIAPLIGRLPRGFFFYAITKYNIGQAEQAADAATKYLAQNPTDPDAIKLYARIELAGRRSAGAIKVLTRAQQQGSADADMLDLLARAYALAGKPELALQTLERAAVLAPRNAEILTRLASLRLALGDAGKATGDFERALDISPQQKEAAEQLVMAAIASGNLEKAAGGLERLRKIEGDSEAVGNLAALIRMAQLDLDGAQQELDAVIGKFPDAVQPRVNLAKVLLLKDRAADAQATLAQILDRQPAETTALTTLVNMQIGEGKIDDALQRLQKAHTAAPKDADVSVALANLYVRRNEAPKAIGLLDDVLKELPGNTILLAAKAKLLGSIGKLDEAKTVYRALLEQNPLDTADRRALADLLVAGKDPDGAKSVLLDGIKAEPGHLDLMQAYVAVALRTGGLDAALAAADQLGRTPANMPNARWLRGDALMAAGRFFDAVTAYASEFRGDDSTVGLLRLVGALNAAGRADQATIALRDWLDKHPDDAEAAEALAQNDLIARRFFDAEKHLQIVLAKRPSDSVALNNLAWAYQQRNDARARPTAQKSYLLNPTPEAADTLGWILVTSGNASTGLGLLRQAAAQLPRNPSVAYHLAVALKDMGHRQQALATLRPILHGLLDFDERPAAQSLFNELSKG